MDNTAEKSAVGIRQLADVMGISTGTISRALNNRSGVNPRTRTRVLEEARRIGYVANSAARALKDRPVLTIGLFFAPYFGPSHEINPAAMSFVDLLRRQAELQTASLQTILYTDNVDLKAQAESNHLDVAVFYGQFGATDFEAVHDVGVPAVVLHYHVRSDDQVAIYIDMHQAAANAVQYLAALGHVDLGLVTGPRQALHGGEFARGFRAALEEFGLMHRPAWDLELPADRANKFGACEALSGPLGGADRPTAILFSSDWMALGGRLAARQSNLRVPEDLSLIGFENMPTAAEVDPPLTTFDVHFPRAAELVIEMAMKLGEARRTGVPILRREILMTAELVKRQSCICLRRKD